MSRFVPQIKALLSEYPKMPATVVTERIGWTGTSSFLRMKVAEIRPDYAPKDPADRIDYKPGDQMQCDLWIPPAKIPLGSGQFGSPPVLVMTASHSRYICARMIPSRTTEDRCLGMWSLLQSFGAVPRRLVWDNESGIGRNHKLTDQVTSLAGTLGMKFVQFMPYDPASKGVVERMNGFFETSFMPGRDFSSPDDFNEQLAAWLPPANSCLVRRTGQRPIDAVESDRASMFALPPVTPVLGVLGRVRLNRDDYPRVVSSDYSAHPSAIGSFVDVTYNLETVRFGALGNKDVGTSRRAVGPAPRRSPIQRTLARLESCAHSFKQLDPRAATTGTATPPGPTRTISARCSRRKSPLAEPQTPSSASARQRFPRARP